MTLDEIAGMPGLQCIQIPHDEFKSWRHAKPHIWQSVEKWAGYVDGDTHRIPISDDDVATLLAQGWVREDLEYWYRLYPPDRPRLPYRRFNGRQKGDTVNADPKLIEMQEAIVRAYPQMESRAEKAVALVAGGRVTATLGAHNYHIASQGTPGRTYHCNIPPHNRPNWTCTIVQDPKTHHTHLPCPDLRFRAPHLKHGRRCKHLIAAWMYRQLKQKEAPAEPQSVEASPAPVAKPEPVHSTTPAPVPQNGTRNVTSRYADGRPARYSDGTIVRYTAGGKAVEIPASSWQVHHD